MGRMVAKDVKDVRDEVGMKNGHGRDREKEFWMSIIVFCCCFIVVVHHKYKIVYLKIIVKHSNAI